MASKVRLTRQLNTYDATNLVIGSTVGADIYVAPALCARLLVYRLKGLQRAWIVEGKAPSVDGERPEPFAGDLESRD